MRAASVGGGKPRVVQRHLHAGLLQSIARALGILAAEAIHDAGLVCVAMDHLQALLQALVAVARADEQVGAVHRTDQAQRFVHAHLLHHVLTHLRRGGGREGVHGRIGERLSQFRKAAIFGAEVVAPLADAVRLVDAQAAHASASQHAREAWPHRALGSGKHDRRRIAVEQRLGFLLLGFG